MASTAIKYHLFHNTANNCLSHKDTKVMRIYGFLKRGNWIYFFAIGNFAEKIIFSMILLTDMSVSIINTNKFYNNCSYSINNNDNIITNSNNNYYSIYKTKPQKTKAFRGRFQERSVANFSLFYLISKKQYSQSQQLYFEKVNLTILYNDFSKI